MFHRMANKTPRSFPVHCWGGKSIWQTPEFSVGKVSCESRIPQFGPDFFALHSSEEVTKFRC